MASLPPEIWWHILLFLSADAEIACTRADLWAKIVTRNRIYEDRLLEENCRTKLALSRVSRRFRELSRPLAWEIITLRTLGSIHRLVRRLREDFRVSSVVSHWTKRINIQVEVDVGNGQFEINDNACRDLFADIEFLLKSCPHLAYLTCSFHGPHLAYGDLLNILWRACPQLDALRCNLVTRKKFGLRPTFPGLTNLRVLELPVAEEKQFTTPTPLELPYLHTLIGSLDTICLHFHDASLPSLRTLICKTSTPSIQYRVPFLRHHGRKIVGLDMSQVFLTEYEIHEYLSNVTELVLGFWDDRVLSSDWPNVQHLGFSAGVDETEETAQIALCSLQILEDQRETGSFPKLRTVRILDDQIAQSLRKSQKRESRSHSWTMRLDDRYGEPLFPPTSQSVSGKSKKFSTFFAGMVKPYIVGMH